MPAINNRSPYAESIDLLYPYIIPCKFDVYCIGKIIQEYFISDKLNFSIHFKQAVKYNLFAHYGVDLISLIVLTTD